jgi:hypothetical protein
MPFAIQANIETNQCTSKELQDHRPHYRFPPFLQSGSVLGGCGNDKQLEVGGTCGGQAKWAYRGCPHRDPGWATKKLPIFY